MTNQNGSDHSGKDTRHRLQNEISGEAAPLVRAVTENLKLIGIFLGAIVLIAAGISGYKYYRQESISSAQKRIESILSQQEPDKKIQAIEKYLPQAPQRFRSGLRLELANLCMEQDRYEKAAEVWGQLAENNSDRQMEAIAGLGRAKALRLSGQGEKALELLRDLSDRVPEAFQKSVYYEIAVAAEEQQNWESALSAYEQLRSQTELGGEQGGFYRYKIARLRNKIAESGRNQTDKDSSS